MRHISSISVLADALRLFLFWLAIPVYGQTLEVAPGALLKITSTQQFMRLKHLKLGDGAKITFADDMSYWQVIAEQVEIGDGVVIDARGLSGRSGSPTPALSAKQAQACRDGAPGEPGKPGSHGGHGVNLSLHLQIKHLGSLQINTTGGVGGHGGRGGDGQQGGATKDCEQTHGGSAGGGGAGGHGGSAGDVLVQYRFSKVNGAAEAIKKRINVIAKAGAAGSGGQAGTAGQGSKARYLDTRTLTGVRKWVAAGKTGSLGLVGQQGRVGMPGNIRFEQHQLRDQARVLSADRRPVTQSASPSMRLATVQTSTQPATGVDALAKPSLAAEKIRTLEQQLALLKNRQKNEQQSVAVLKKQLQQQQRQIEALQNRPAIKAISVQGCR